MELKQRVAAYKWHISYLNKVARELRVIVKREKWAQGFEPIFDKGNSYSVGINAGGDPFVQINFTRGGQPHCANYAI
jgi:hypothetical protein